KRVVITGIGAVTPIGIGKEEYWHSLLEGKSGVDYIKAFDTEDFETTIAAEVKDFQAKDYIDRKEAKRMDRFSQFAVVGTKLALDDGKIDLENLNKERIGVMVGSGIGGMDTLEKGKEKLMTKGPRRVSPLFIPMLISNM